MTEGQVICILQPIGAGCKLSVQQNVYWNKMGIPLYIRIAKYKVSLSYGVGIKDIITWIIPQMIVNKASPIRKM